MSQVVFLQNLQPVHLGFAMHAPVHSGVQLQNLKLPASIAKMLASTDKPSAGSGPSCGGKGSGASSCSA